MENHSFDLEDTMYPSPEVQEILETLLQAIHATLEQTLEGIYLRGSLVTGDFDLETSDVDLLVVVSRDLNQADFEQLDAMHKDLQTLPNRYANEIELAYVPVADINGFQPGKNYISLERSEQLRWKQLRHNWVLEFWSVREKGIALFGPQTKSFIKPILMSHVADSIRLELGAWLEYVDTWQSPGWQTHAGEMRFTVETMCRVMYTLELHQLCSKPVAVGWALHNLDEPWNSLIRESQSWQAGGAVNPSTTEQIAEFTRWVIAKEQT